MLQLVEAGGWLMVPILLCSVLAAAIAVERFWSLQPSRIAPRNLLSQVWAWIRNDEMDSRRLRVLRDSCPLGEILAAGLLSASRGRDAMKESIDEAAEHVLHELERYLTALGTIASVSPLLGLLGTVIGMIKTFTAIMVEGTGNAQMLAGGISQALITTAAGLSVAIPALILHRFFVRRVDELVLLMEREANRLVDVMSANAHPGSDHDEQGGDSGDAH